MRLSKAFLKTYKEAPKEAQIVSHQLMLRAFMINQLTRGFILICHLDIEFLKR